LWLSRRCLAYNNSLSQHSHWSPNDQLGCREQQECVPDDLQCLLTPCTDPIGWCLPNERAKNYTRSMKAEIPMQRWYQKMSRNAVLRNSSDSCSNHGRCQCDYGYTGDDCEKEVNWCEQPVQGFNNSEPIKNVCGLNGTCVSQPAGASCICQPGFTGEFCNEIIPSEAYISLRCYAYVPQWEDATVSPGILIGCGSGKACVPDNLQCLLAHCRSPIGWCLPLLEVDLVRFRMMLAKVAPIY